MLVLLLLTLCFGLPLVRSNQALAPNSPDAFIHLNDAVQAARRPAVHRVGLRSKAVAALLWGPLYRHTMADL